MNRSRAMRVLTVGLAGPAAGHGGPGAVPFLDRYVSLLVLLLAMSMADVSTTALAVSLGHPELSPGGALALTGFGLPGLAFVKLWALAFVVVLTRGWPVIGRAVTEGLTVLTAVAVAWNVAQLGNAAAVA